MGEEDMILIPRRLAESFAHTGADFGFGAYIPSNEEIEEIRGILEDDGDARNQVNASKF